VPVKQPKVKTPLALTEPLVENVQNSFTFDSASNRNEYQEYSWGKGQQGSTDDITTTI
jgi:hypothetical protein